MSFDVSVINKYTPFAGDNIKINELAVDDLKLSDAVQKRLWKNSILKSFQIDNYFQTIVDTLNGLKFKNCEVKFLIKGTHAWEKLFAGLPGVELMPQNFDLEVYVLNNSRTNACLKEVILSLINNLILIKTNLKEKGSFDTCLYLSDNIKINRRDKPVIRCDSDQLSTPLVNSKVIELGDAEDLEVFKGWLLSLCFQANNYPNYNDDEYCGHTNTFSHQLFNISIFQIKNKSTADLMRSDSKYYLQNLETPSYSSLISKKNSNTEYFLEYFNQITSLDQNSNRYYLNSIGLLLYDCFIKRVLSFRTEKGRNLEEFRLNLLKQFFMSQIPQSINNFVQAYYICNILSNVLGLCPELLANQYFMGSLQSEIVESMLVNYTLPSLPNGIKQNIDDVVIGYFRPIMNSIILELKMVLEGYIPKFVKVFIAGGDGFERYISTGKIADIDIKVVILKKEGKDMTQILEAVQKIIVHTLSKHAVFLNYLIKRKGYLHNKIDEDILYNNDLLKAGILCPQGNVSLDSKLTDSIPVGYNFKLCPQAESSSFRLRSLYKIQNMEGYHLLSLDYRKKFWVYYKNPYNDQTSIPLYYKYDLAILDIPIILFDDSHWREDFIELQNGYVDNNPLNFGKKLQLQFDISDQDAMTPLTSAPFFPLASKLFLIYDILERFNEESKRQLRERYLAGKIPKDVSRFLTLGKDIQTGKAPDTKFNTYSKVYFIITNNQNFSGYLQRASLRDLRQDILFYASNILRKIFITRESKISNDFKFDGVDNKKLRSVSDVTSHVDIINIYTPDFLTSFTCKLDDPEEDYKLVNMVPGSDVGSPAEDVSIEDEILSLMNALHLQNPESAKNILAKYGGKREEAINGIGAFVMDISKKFNTEPQVVIDIIDLSNGQESRIGEILQLLQALNIPFQSSLDIVKESINTLKGDLNEVYKRVSLIRDLASNTGLNLGDAKNILEMFNYNVDTSIKYLQTIKELEVKTGVPVNWVKFIFDKVNFQPETAQSLLDLIKKFSETTGVTDIKFIIDTLDSKGWNYVTAINSLQR